MDICSHGEMCFMSFWDIIMSGFIWFGFSSRWASKWCVCILEMTREDEWKMKMENLKKIMFYILIKRRKRFHFQFTCFFLLDEWIIELMMEFEISSPNANYCCPNFTLYMNDEWDTLPIYIYGFKKPSRDRKKLAAIFARIFSSTNIVSLEKLF